MALSLCTREGSKRTPVGTQASNFTLVSKGLILCVYYLLFYLMEVYPSLNIDCHCLNFMRKKSTSQTLLMSKQSFLSNTLLQRKFKCLQTTSCKNHCSNKYIWWYWCGRNRRNIRYMTYLIEEVFTWAFPTFEKILKSRVW